MRFGGFQRFSMIDYPDKVCAIAFTQGCNFRCPYCHNPELVEPQLFNKPYSKNKALDFLEERRGKLDAVVITGGEPTMHSGLLPFIRKVRKMGFLLKLDTNGSNPGVLKKMLKSKEVDYVAMDIKAPLRKYGSDFWRADPESIRQSIKIILESGVPYEFRTTVVNGLLGPEDILEIAQDIKGATKYVLQKFLPTKTLNPDYLQEDTYNDQEFEKMRDSVLNLVAECIVR